MPRPNRGPYLVFLKKRGVYYIRWAEKGRTRERSTRTTSRESAEAILETFLRDRRQSVGPRDPSQILISEALESYAVEHARETASPERIGYAIEALVRFWEESAVADITEETCKAYRRERGRSDGTIRRELVVLRAALNHEFRKGRLTRVPTIWLPPKPDGKDRWLTRSEAASLLSAACSEPKARLYLPLFILIGLYTGARKTAILELRWSQIDMERGRIDFNPPGRKRTSKGRPVLPIPRSLHAHLKRAHHRGSDIGCVLNIDGKPIGDIKTSFGSARRKAGLDDVTPHTLRHTAGTWMAQKGVPLHEIAGWLGHSHERTTELYAHHHPEYLKAAKAAME